jgi:hypothetical protein
LREELLQNSSSCQNEYLQCRPLRGVLRLKKRQFWARNKISVIRDFAENYWESLVGICSSSVCITTVGLFHIFFRNG